MQTNHPAVRVGTWNAYQRSNNIRAHHGLVDFASAVDIGCVQEFGGAIRLGFLQDLKAEGFDFFKPTGRPTAPAVIYRTERFDFRRGHAVLLAKGRDVPAAKGKRSHLDDYWGTVVVLWDKVEQREVVVGNIHTVAHVEFWPGPRRAMYKESLVSLLADPDIQNVRVGYIGGDFNWALTRKHCLPRRVLRAHGWYSCWSEIQPNHTTEGKRTIDGVFSHQKAKRARVLTNIHVGDHLPAVADF